MADGVDAVVHVQQAPVGKAARDRAVAEAEVAKLHARHDAVLAAGERRDPLPRS